MGHNKNRLGGGQTLFALLPQRRKIFANFRTEVFKIMQDFNQKITCDVCDCCYNENGTKCKKDSICVSCGEKGCTRCASYRAED